MRVTKNEKLLAWPMVHAMEMVALGWASVFRLMQIQISLEDPGY